MDRPGLRDYLFALPQYLLPHHLLSGLAWAFTRLRLGPVTRLMIRWFVHRYGVNLAEARDPDPGGYPTFNAFFTRALKPGARPLAAGPGEAACPVDGTVSRAGPLEGGRILQAKGMHFSATELLGGDAELAAPFENGGFATLYLSPRDYHRIHMPLGGRLRAMVHVPGRLFSVNAATTRCVPRLFARNERVACLFDTEAGPMALVLVGALFVGSIETVWHGEVTPPTRLRVRRWDYTGAAQPVLLEKGQEMGRFNMGSTVIVMFGAGRARMLPAIAPGTPVRMGQPLARLAAH